MLANLTRTLNGSSLAVLDVGGVAGDLLDILHKANPNFSSFQIVDLDQNAGVIANSKGFDFFH